MNRLNLKPQHWRIITAFIASLAAMIGGLAHGWHDALTTTFVAGVLLQVTAMIDALTAGSAVSRDPNRTYSERRADKGVGV